MTDTHDGKI